MTSTMKSVRVADDQAGGRLDRVLATHIAELSRTRFKALIERATPGAANTSAHKR